MRHAVECEGKIRLGSLSAEASERLARFSGDWLEFAPDEQAIVIRHVQPEGCPAMLGVPCELVSMLDALPADARESMPGGTLFVKDPSGQVLRLLVEGGELRIQWPREDYSRAVAVPPETVLSDLDSRRARVTGWVRLGGSPASAKRIEDFVDRFEGLYPEGDLTVKCEGKLVHVQFRDVNVGPAELLAKLREVADPPGSLEAELQLGSFARGATEQDFRLRIDHGEIQTLRPSLWRNG